PNHIRLENRSDDRLYLAIYTQFLREVVALRSWSSTCGYHRFKNVVSINFPVRKSLTEKKLSALKEELGALQARLSPAPDPSDSVDVPRLRRRVKKLKDVIEKLANNVDFSPHAGAGVVEQSLFICENSFNLKLWQLRKYSADSQGSRITTVVPLHLLKRDNLLADGPNPNPGAMGRGIPPAHICAQCDHMRIRQHFVNPDKEFEHECYCEDVFVPTLEDVVLFGRALHELIAAARELQFHGS
ncbi:MAG: hypothetical protein ABL962_21385, partial [Fimbriimonadaceae bacterium]